VISCDSIQINLSNVFYEFSRIKFLTKKPKKYYQHQFVDSKNSADLHPTSGQIRRPLHHSWPSEVLELDYCHLISKYPTISRYRDMERHDISISSLGYDMNPNLFLLNDSVTGMPYRSKV